MILRRRRDQRRIEVLDARELDAWCPDCGTGLVEVVYATVSKHEATACNKVHACADEEFCGWWKDADGEA